MKQNYKLTATTLKNGKTLYQVIDETGKVISKRTSTREYVACTIDGRYYFGSLDLIGKGDHGNALSRIQDLKENTPEKYAQICKDRIAEIKYCNKAHLSMFRKYSTPEELNAPIKDWQYKHLVEFYGQEVADSVKTEWEYQVATTNDERDIQLFLNSIGDYETWKMVRENYVAETEPLMQIAYLEK